MINYLQEGLNVGVYHKVSIPCKLEFYKIGDNK